MQAGDKIKFIGDDRRYYFYGDYSKGQVYDVISTKENYYYAWGGYSTRLWITIKDNKGKEREFPMLEKDYRAFHKNWEKITLDTQGRAR